MRACDSLRASLGACRPVSGPLNIFAMLHERRLSHIDHTHTHSHAALHCTALYTQDIAQNKSRPLERLLVAKVNQRPSRLHVYEHAARLGSQSGDLNLGRYSRGLSSASGSNFQPDRHSRLPTRERSRPKGRQYSRTWLLLVRRNL